MRKMRRREFLARSIAGLGAVTLGSRLIFAQKTKPVMFDPYQLVPLGKTGLKVSLLGAGTGAHGGDHNSNQTRLGKEKFEALVKAEYDRGVRMFDMADMYGTHPFVGAALKGLPRDKYVLASKIGTWRPAEEERDKPDVIVNRFLKEIGTDYLDLALLHCMMAGDWNKQNRKYMDGLAELKKKGIIRAHGISCHSIAALETAANEPWVDSVHVRINAYGEEMDDMPDKVLPVLKKVRQAGKGVVAMKLVANGNFRYEKDKIDNSIKYVLEQGCADVMIVGFESPDELDDFAGRVRKVPTKAV